MLPLDVKASKATDLAAADASSLIKMDTQATQFLHDFYCESEVLFRAACFRWCEDIKICPLPLILISIFPAIEIQNIVRRERVRDSYG